MHNSQSRRCGQAIILTPRRRGAEKDSHGSLCASAPLREICLGVLAVCTLTAAIGQDVAPAVGAAKTGTVAATAESWPVYRGDPEARGIAGAKLPDKLDMLWKMSVPGGAFEATPVIDGDVVYVPDMDGKVYALNLATGKEIWTFKVESGFIASPAIRGGLLYVGDIDGKFYALDIKTGKPKWTHDAEAEIDSAPNFWKDNVLFGSQDSKLYCLNAATGQLVWKHAIEDQIRCSPTVVGDRTFVAGCDAKFHIIDLSTGNEVAAVPIEAPTGVTPAALGDQVFFGTSAGTFFAVNWKDAKVSWKVEDKGGGQEMRSSPAAQDGIVIVGSRNRAVIAYDPANGNEKWTFTTKQRVDSSPVIVGSRVFAGAADGRLYALDLKTGAELWQYQATGGFTGSPAVAGGKLVIATDRGVVYCFGAK